MKPFKTAFRLAVLTAAVTYGLIVLGGVVFNTGSSLACPDWPLCNGQVFPEMTGGVLYEHSHRILGTIVGLCSIGLCWLLWTPRPPLPSLRRWGALLLLLVIAQGVLGGIIVIYQLPPLVRMAHLGTSMIVLMLALYLCRATWVRARDAAAPPPAPIPGARGVAGLLVVTILAVFLQILFGALVRHTGATFSLQLGWPGSIVAVDPVSGQPTLWPGSAPQQANVLHRYVAPLIALMVTVACARAFVAARGAGRTRLALWAWGPVALVLVQILLGVAMLGTMLNVGSILSIAIRTAHLGVAALLLANLFLLILGFAAREAALTFAIGDSGQEPWGNHGLIPAQNSRQQWRAGRAARAPGEQLETPARRTHLDRQRGSEAQPQAFRQALVANHRPLGARVHRP